MTSTLERFNERAEEAERRLNALQATINRLSAKNNVFTSIEDTKQNDDEPWEFWYWPAKSRGNCVRLVFEECNVPYITKVTSMKNMDELNSQIRSDLFGTQTNESPGFWHVMASPFIKKGDFMMSQSVEIAGYLSTIFGLRPKSDKDHALAQMIAGNCSDVLSEIYRNRDMGNEKFMEFVNGRLQIWLDIFEKPLTQSSDQLYYFEGRCTQADLIVFSMLEGLEELFQKLAFEKYVASSHPILNKLYVRVGKRESVKRLMAEQKSYGLESYSARLGWGNVQKAVIDSLTAEDKKKKAVIEY